MSNEITVYEFNRLKLKSLGYDILKEKMLLQSKILELDQTHINILSQLKAIDETEQRDKEEKNKAKEPTELDINVDPITSEVVLGPSILKKAGK